MGKLTRSVAAGFAGGLAFVLLLGVLSGWATSRARAVDVARDALRSDPVAHPFSHPEEDSFTECALLVTMTARAPGVARNVVETWLPMEAVTLGHPCQTLRRYVDGEITYTRAPGGRVNGGDRWDLPYVSYWFGSRHLEAVVLRVLSFEHAQDLYRLLSYGSVVALALGAWYGDRRSALVLLPVFAPVFTSLLLAFSVHLNGHLLGHAPGFFVSFLLLAVLASRRRWFGTFERRLAFFAFLAVIASFFDLLDGVLLLVLSLSVVVNHFLYSRDERGKVALGHAVAIAGCFALCYAAVTAVHLGLLGILHEHVWQTYVNGLTVRLGSVADTGQRVGPGDVALALWSKRGNLLAGGTGPATWFLAGGFGTWVFTAAALLPALRGRRDDRLPADLAVLALAAGGIVAWCLLFPNHTFVHRGFTVRYLTLPAAYGAVAALLVVNGWARSRPRQETAPVSGAVRS